MLLDHLRVKTHASHQAVEKLLIPRFKNLNGRQDYMALLQLFYGYFAPLEQSAFPYIHQQTVPDLAARRKSAALLNDMQWLSGTQICDMCNDLPEIADEADALAAMYVLEGSTLGGRVIMKMVTTQLQFNSAAGTEFFNGYGEDTGRRWTSFTSLLNAYTSDVATMARMATTADNTFLKFQDWITRN